MGWFSVVPCDTVTLVHLGHLGVSERNKLAEGALFNVLILVADGASSNTLVKKFEVELSPG